MSDARVTTISDLTGSGPVTLTAQQAAKASAFVSGPVSALASSFNISSITDVGVGRWRLTLSTAMVAAYQSATFGTSFTLDETSGDDIINGLVTTPSQVFINNRVNNNTYRDAYCSTAVHGDLA